MMHALAQYFEASGVTAADQLRWSDAADAFDESYRLLPRPTTLKNLGLAHRALGRYSRAIDELQALSSGGNPEAGVRAADRAGDQ